MESLILSYVGSLNISIPMDGMIRVRLAFSLLQLYEVNQAYNTMTSSGSVVMDWSDENFRWSPEDFGGVRVIRVPLAELWTPDLYAYYGSDMTAKTTPLQVRITSEGAQSVEVPFHLRTFCGIDVDRFPFDRQSCDIVFGSWSYDETELLWEPSSVVDLDNYFANQEWRLIDAEVERRTLATKAAGNFSTAVLRLNIAREPFYYIFNLVIPATTVVVTSILGMHAPSSPGTRRQPRFQLGVVTLLPMGVMLLSIVNDLPKFALTKVPGPRGSFSGVPLLGMYYLALLLTVSLCCTTYNVFVALDGRAAEGRAVPGWLRALTTGRRKARVHPGKLTLEGGELFAANGGAKLGIRSWVGEREGSKALAAEWERLIRRLEFCSLCFYLCLVCLWLWLLFHNDWR